jgi:GntR family transcriptional regulator
MVGPPDRGGEVGRSAPWGEIDHTSPVPKYSQLREILLDLTASEASVHTAIPSERDLGQRFGLSRMTVRQAVDALVAEGRLYRVQGKGTFVSPHKIVMPLQLTSFTQDMSARGLVAGSVDLGRREVPATESLADALRLRPGEPVFVLERLRTADGSPMAIERAHVPASVAPGLLDESLENKSLYRLLRERYGLVLDEGEQTIEAVSASAADADLLCIPRGSPVLLLVRHSSAAGRPVEHVVSTYRGDRYQLRVALDVSAIPDLRPPGGAGTGRIPGAAR